MIIWGWAGNSNTEREWTESPSYIGHPGHCRIFVLGQILIGMNTYFFLRKSQVGLYQTNFPPTVPVGGKCVDPQETPTVLWGGKCVEILLYVNLASITRSNRTMLLSYYNKGNFDYTMRIFPPTVETFPPNVSFRTSGVTISGPPPYDHNLKPDFYLMNGHVNEKRAV